MNKSIKQFIRLLSASAVLASGAAMAQPIPDEDNACRQEGYVIGYFNGIMNTPADAQASLNELERVYGDKYIVNDEGITYEIFYNQTDGFRTDLVELRSQRLEEHARIYAERYEFYLEGGGSFGDSQWGDQVLDFFASADVREARDEADNAEAALDSALLWGAARPATEVVYAEHRTRLDSLALEGKKMLFVAHSQGNLFVNAAYDYVLTKAPASSVAVVHVAPASPTVRGPYVLADKDEAINRLRSEGFVLDYTDVIPGYFSRPAAPNGETDIMGHGFIPIYFNQNLDISARVKGHISAALDALETPPAPQASQGFFTVTVTWNGEGDVDTHVYEPGGGHVYYPTRARQGSNGFLDVDNTTAFGPEHYFATCKKSALASGIYRVGIANYARAEGRAVTVQVASWNDGVLGTQTLIMDGETRDVPAYFPFDVFVFKHPETEAYSVSLQ